VPRIVVLPVTVAVTPATQTVYAGAMRTFMATRYEFLHTTVTWSVNGVAGGNSTVGMISIPAGAYTAPTTVPSPATVTVKANVRR